jgi:hypothetical protein
MNAELMIQTETNIFIKLQTVSGHNLSTFKSLFGRRRSFIKKSLKI